MAADESSTSNSPIAIAPAPADHAQAPHDESSRMPYTCQNCARRKVKCDRTTPICSSCHRGKLRCVYQAPPPRSRKRRLSHEIIQKLARYERVLRENGLLEEAEKAHPGETPSTDDHISLHWHEPLVGSGKFLAGEGRSRYIHGSLWRTLEDDEMQRVSDAEDEDDDDDMMHDAHIDARETIVSDPLTGAFLDLRQDISLHHPSHEDAMILWKIHAENVEPLCKILHIPSAGDMVQKISQNPATASKAQECQLFAIYHFAVYSMTDDQCVEKFGERRAVLMDRYNFCTRSALVNASFLRTSELSVLQAMVLFLIPCRFHYDSQTFWVLTGVAIRIAQRIGLHRDGQKLGLPPFEVQMRRRLFYQLLPLEGISSQIAGTGISMGPESWDTEPALNLNDEDIWPDMTETPQEHQGATEMIFCLARSCIGKHFGRTGNRPHSLSSQFKDYTEAETFINEAENEVEEKYIRYCDVANPLHFLAMGLARAGIASMRLRIRLQKVKNKSATFDEKRGMFQLAMKLLDTDAAVHSHQGVNRFQWHVRPLSLFGTWDSLTFVLTSILKDQELLSDAEIDTAWNRIEQLLNNHDEILESKRALYQVFRRLTLKAWDARPPTTARNSTPDFIASLRSRQQLRTRRRQQRQTPNTYVTNSGNSSASVVMDHSGGLADMLGADLSDEFDADTTDWAFWEHVTQNHQAQ